MRRAAPAFAQAVNRSFGVIVNGAFLIAMALGIAYGSSQPVYGIGLAVLAILNGLVHLGGAILFKQYAPGMVTALALYFPISGLILWNFGADGRLEGGNLFFGLLLGLAAQAIPVIWLAAAGELRRRQRPARE